MLNDKEKSSFIALCVTKVFKKVECVKTQYFLFKKKYQSTIPKLEFLLFILNKLNYPFKLIVSFIFSKIH